MTDRQFWNAVGSDFKMNLLVPDLLKENEDRVLSLVKKNCPMFEDPLLLLDYITTYESVHEMGKSDDIKCTPAEFYKLCCRWRDIHAISLILQKIGISSDATKNKS